MNTRLVVILLIIIILVGLILAALPHVTVFEDGSWALGDYPYVLHGCIRNALCRVGG